MLRRALFVLVSLLIAPMGAQADVMVGGITVSDPGASVGTVSVAEYTGPLVAICIADATGD